MINCVDEPLKICYLCMQVYFLLDLELDCEETQSKLFSTHPIVLGLSEKRNIAIYIQMYGTILIDITGQ